MAVFGRAKSTSKAKAKAKKELTGLQQHKAVFSKGTLTANKFRPVPFPIQETKNFKTKRQRARLKGRPDLEDEHGRHRRGHA